MWTVKETAWESATDVGSDSDIMILFHLTNKVRGLARLIQASYAPQHLMKLLISLLEEILISSISAD